MKSKDRAIAAAADLGTVTGHALNSAYGNAFNAVLGNGLERKGIPRSSEGQIAVAIANEVARARREVVYGFMIWNLRIFCGMATLLTLFGIGLWSIAIAALCALIFSPALVLRDVG